MNGAGQYRVNEIFCSLQGEGAHTGTPAVFVRFSGCNLACPFCDTDFSAYTVMTADGIMEEINKYSCTFVILTGGEPSLQIDDKLIELLHNNNKYICVETNGTHILPENIDWVTCSPKENTKILLNKADELKVVYLGQEVEHWRQTILARHYFLQPCYDKTNGANTQQTINYILQHPWWRLSLQTHKLTGIR